MAAISFVGFTAPQNVGPLVPQHQGVSQDPLVRKFFEVISGLCVPGIQGPIDLPDRGLFRVLLPQDFLMASSGPMRLQGLKAAREILKNMRLAFQGLLPEKPHLLQLQEIACDCACQVRAIENLIFAKELQKDSGTIVLVAKALSSAEGALAVLSNSLPSEPRVDEEQLTTQALLAPIENVLSHLRLVDVKILTLSRILNEVRTEAKLEGGKKLCCVCCGLGLDQAKRVQTVKDKFAKCFGSSELSTAVIFRSQEHLAEVSSTRLIELVQDKHLPISKLLTSDAFKPVSRGEIGGALNQLPCFLTVEASLQLAAAHKIEALVLRKATNHAIAKSSKDDGHCIDKIPCKVIVPEGEGFARLVPSECLEGDSPFLVIEGLRAGCSHGQQVQADLRQMDLAEIIRENAAAHPQFTDGKAFIPELRGSEATANAGQLHSDIARARQEELMTLQDGRLASCLGPLMQRAVQDGCVIEDPRLFLITHIFPCSLKEAKTL